MDNDKLIKSLKIQFEEQIKINKELNEELVLLKKENNELKAALSKSKERGAGRKNKFTEQEMEMIKMYRFQGKSIRELAAMFECSVGLISKICSN